MLTSLLVSASSVGLEPLGLSVPESIAGTLPGWITAGSMASILWLLLRSGLTWRGQSIGVDQNIRDHYAKELERLTNRLDEQDRHFRDRVRESDERHDLCVREREKLREELADVRSELKGLHAQIARYSSDRLLILESETGQPGQQAPAATASAQRVKDATDNADDS